MLLPRFHHTLEPAWSKEMGVGAEIYLNVCRGRFSRCDEPAYVLSAVVMFDKPDIGQGTECLLNVWRDLAAVADGDSIMLVRGRELYVGPDKSPNLADEVVPVQDTDIDQFNFWFCGTGYVRWFNWHFNYHRNSRKRTGMVQFPFVRHWPQQFQLSQVPKAWGRERAQDD
jgi:hypothetical protein